MEKKVDAVYVTRFQKERWVEKDQPYPKIDRKFLNEPKYSEASVLHPLPRVGELDAAVLQQAAPTVQETDHRCSVPHVAGTYDCPNHRVQPGTVAASGEDSDPHDPILSCQSADGSGPRAAS